MIESVGPERRYGMRPDLLRWSRDYVVGLEARKGRTESIARAHGAFTRRVASI